MVPSFQVDLILCVFAIVNSNRNRSSITLLIIT